MENLKALIHGRDLTAYQKGLALQEFEKMQKDQREMFLNMQYYYEYCQMKGYVTPQEWIEKHKHF